MFLLLLIIIAVILIALVISTAIKQHKSGTTQRPVILTILCLIMFIGAALFLIANFSLPAKGSIQIGYAPGITLVLLIIACYWGVIGIWNMKKLGAYLFIGSQLAGLLISLIDKESLMEIKEIGYASVLIQALCVGIVLYNFNKITD